MKRIFSFVLLLLCAACATYQDKVEGSRKLIKQGDAAAAAEKLKPLAEESNRDQLVYLLDYATALQASHNYKESIDAFRRADKLADMNDYQSISKDVLATMGSETMLQYKGDSFEKILINAMLAMDYIMINQFDDAAVEARRVNEKINKFRADGRKNYELNPFANYLTGLIWEADQKWDDAYISYNDAYKIDPTNPELAEDLLRSARKSHRDDDYKDWKQKFPQVVENKDWYDNSKGQLVILIEQGWSPEKKAIGNGLSIMPPSTVGWAIRAADRKRYPFMIPVHSDTQYVEATIEGQGPTYSRPVYDVEKVAIKTFEDDLGWLMARRAAADVAKAVAADQVKQKNELLGFLTGIAMQATDQADLRQWSTLPKTMQVARRWLPAGTYKVSLQGLNGPGRLTSDHLDNQEVTIRPGKISFLVWRAVK